LKVLVSPERFSELHRCFYSILIVFLAVKSTNATKLKNAVLNSRLLEAVD